MKQFINTDCEGGKTMFGQPQTTGLVLERVDTSSILQEASEEAFLSFQCFTETNSLSVLNEASFIKEKFIQIIETIISYIRLAAAKITAFIDAKFKNLDTIVKKYRPQIDALPEETIQQLRYQKIIYNMSAKVPGIIDTTLIANGITTLSSSKITGDVVRSLKSQIDPQTALMRGQMLGVTGPVSESNFDSMLQKAFKPSAEASETNMKKDDLLQMLDDLDMFEMDKKSIRASQGMIINMMAEYKSQLGRIYSMSFSENSSNVSIQQSDKTFTVNILEASYYKEYQTILTNLIMNVVNLYSVIFDAKVNALKEKFEREQDIVRQVVYLIQDRKAG
jgi:hypothetical protein